MQRRVRTVFQRIAGEFPSVDVGEGKAGEGALRWVNIDAGQEMDKVSAEIWEYVQDLVGGVGTRLGRLWNNVLSSSTGPSSL